MEWEINALMRASGITNQLGRRGCDEEKKIGHDELIAVVSSRMWLLALEITEPDSGAGWRLVMKLQ